MAIEATSMGRVQSADLLLKDLEACCVVWSAGDWAQDRIGDGRGEDDILEAEVLVVDGRDAARGNAWISENRWLCCGV